MATLCQRSVLYNVVHYCTIIILYMFIPNFYQLNSTVCFAVMQALYSVQCTVYIEQWTVYSLQCTVYSKQYTVYSIQYNVHYCWCPVLSELSIKCPWVHLYRTTMALSISIGSYPSWYCVWHTATQYTAMQ